MTRQGRGPDMSRRSLLRLGALAGAGAALGPLAACAGPTGVPGPGTLTLALNRSLVSLDNKLNQFDAAVTVQRAVRQALTRVGTDLSVEPVLAETFEATTPTTWTVRLREGACYSDGSPVTPEDVGTALEMYQQVNGSFVASFFPEFPTVVPVDERTFTLETERPVPALDFLMANILVTPAAGNRPEELQDGIGSGPYVVTAANRGTGEYTLSRNDAYWGTAPRARTVRVRFMPEESSRVVSIRSGEVDVIDSITPDSADQLLGLPGVRMERAQSTRINQLFYNFRKPADHPLSDARVREALTYAIDGRALAEDVLVGSVTPAEGVVPTGLRGAVPTGGYVYDPAQARQRLDALGVDDLAVTVIWESGEFAGDAFVMEAVHGMLTDIGVRVTLRQFEPGGDILSWRQGRAGDWDILGNGFSSPTGLAESMLQGMFAGTAAKEETRDTYHGYVFPHVTDLIERASAEPDADRRAELMTEAQQAVWDTWPCLWAFVPNVVLAHQSRVRDIALGPTNCYDLAAVRVEG
ncbi:ABC transporter substrate-binding protein [Marinitenerispora sediminis]|uniref:ABC transporter substrate-binding protein n=2 Tax=Marinitenerispora sediminis TaxID=1931232 RepID=A0A368T4Z3_9ACTN|nr:ABC transporter substrate-binding protein [Marinitenerispora sediminis]RCV50460.1 ABC transporter substrate-binding protein [Marinitenerispora sediminis]RCV53934.1 ABC transporter substrate-binding protein [Marinitenerispora sediminis]